jgi:hypothetical protein
MMVIRYILFVLVCSTAHAEPLPCDEPMILVDTDDRGLFQRVCDVAMEALPRLETCHLRQQQPIVFRFEEYISSSNAACLGLYHHGKNRIDLLTPEAFRSAHTLSDYCSVVPEAEHYDSIIVHELTHALLDQSPCRESACRIDQEYIAYAMQIDVMPKPVRDQFLSSVRVTAPVEVGQINEFILDFSPSSFAAAAWLHFTSSEHGCEFVGSIVRGEHTLWQEPY